MSSSTMDHVTSSTNYEYDRSMLRRDIEDLFDKVVADCFPYPYYNIEPCSIYFPLEGKARENYGDFAFDGVINICQQLRKEDPRLFNRTGPISIAEKIKERFESRNYSMIKRLDIHDAGILTFSIEGHWMARRINKMLMHGIDTWAPTLLLDAERGSKIMFVLPTNPGMGADIVRAIYIKDALSNLFLFSGFDVGRGFCNDEARRKAQQRSRFIDLQRKRRSHDVYTDLGTLWYGAYIKKIDVMVHLTPHRLRGYIKECHTAAEKEGWLPNVFFEGRALAPCGFQSFSDEQPALRGLFKRFIGCERSASRRFRELGIADQYTWRTFFECAFKFTCLKSHRLAKCIFKYQDIVDEEVNTFVSLLKTQALVCKVTKKSRGRKFQLNALYGKERELGLHLMEFTEAIYRACTLLLPHVVCEYLCHLSRLVMCCSRSGEAWPGLCWATEVVMEKCFQLLGIDPSRGEWTEEFNLFFKHGANQPHINQPHINQPHITPLSEDARFGHPNKYPNSRLEIFSMYVDVEHEFEEGNITGSVTFVDKCRLADGDGWVGLDENDDCHVSFFNREWYNDKVTISNGSYISLGNTSCIRSIPFSPFIKVECLIKATSKDKDKTYLICNDSGSADLSRFWDGKRNTFCGTFEFNRDDGRILLDFIAIKEAVDTTIELSFDLFKTVRLSGLITASYGKDILRGAGVLGEYTAHIFKANPNESIRCGTLPLHKSALAVPADGSLILHAILVDAETMESIVDAEVKLCEGGSLDGVSTWEIPCDIGSIELRVKWVHQMRTDSSQAKVGDKRTRTG